MQIQFDPNEVSYEDLLNVFWSVHDPTTKNRQGPDIGSQYRSMIAYHTPEQGSTCQKVKRGFREFWKIQWKKKIVTEIVSASTFYKAEEYHQKYYQKSGKAGGTCYL